MKPRISHKNTPQLFLRARENLMAHFRPILSHFQLTDQQWRILRALDEHEQLEPRELCELCQILSPSMTGVLARMDEAKLIQRQRTPEDQRRVVVKLAKKGNQLIDEIAPLIDLQYKNIEKVIGKEALEKLAKTLESFLSNESALIEHIDLSEHPYGSQQTKN